MTPNTEKLRFERALLPLKFQETIDDLNGVFGIAATAPAERLPTRNYVDHFAYRVTVIVPDIPWWILQT